MGCFLSQGVNKVPLTKCENINIQQLSSNSFNILKASWKEWWLIKSNGFRGSDISGVWRGKDGLFYNLASSTVFATSPYFSASLFFHPATSSSSSASSTSSSSSASASPATSHHYHRWHRTTTMTTKGKKNRESYFFRKKCETDSMHPKIQNFPSFEMKTNTEIRTIQQN